MTLRYQFIIDGLDRSDKVKLGFTITRSLSSYSTLRISTISTDGSYIPSLSDVIQVYDNAYSPAKLLFEGQIEQIECENINGTPAVECVCQCADYSAIIDKRVVVRHFPVGAYGTLSTVMADLVDWYMEGYTYDSANSVESIIGTVMFDGCTLRQALQTLDEMSGTSWLISSTKTVRNISSGEQYLTAPISITDASENYVRAVKKLSTSTFANTVYARSTRFLASSWTDTWTGNGSQTIFPTTSTLDEAPIVTLNDVAQTVLEQSETGGSPPPVYDWYWIMNGSGVFQNPLDTPISGSDELKITYDSPIPYIAVASSPVSIEEDGLKEALISNENATTTAALDEAAQNELYRRMEVPVDVEIVTREDGFEPGQLVTVEITKPAINGDYFCEAVSGREVGQHLIEWTLNLTSRNKKTAGHSANPAQYFIDVIDKTRKPIETSPISGGGAYIRDYRKGGGWVGDMEVGDLMVWPFIIECAADEAVELTKVAIIAKPGDGPTGDDLIVDGEYSTDDGGTWSPLFATTKVVMPDGELYGEQSTFASSPISLSNGTRLRFPVDQVGSTNPGTNIAIEIRGQVVTA